MDNKNQVMKKKILFLTPSLGIGGLERVQVTIANRLVEEGYDVTVMILDPIDTLKDLLDERVRLVYKTYKNHWGKRFSFIRHRYYDDGVWETRASADSLYRYYVGNQRFDVEIAFFRGLCLKILSGSDNYNAKHIAWVHSDVLKARGYDNCFRSQQELYRAYAGLDKIVCVSREAEQTFIGGY